VLTKTQRFKLTPIITFPGSPQEKMICLDTGVKTAAIVSICL